MKTRNFATRTVARVSTVVCAGLAVWLGGPSLSRGASIQDTVKSTYEKLTGTGEYKANSQGVTRHEMKQLDAFLKKGPAFWSISAPLRIPNGVQSQVLGTDGALKDTLLTRYLVWKRDQAPIFFDKRHPTLATAMQHNDDLRQQAQLQSLLSAITQPPKSAAFQVLTPPPPSSSTTTAATESASAPGSSSSVQAMAQTIDGSPAAAASVPEPASVASTVVLFGLAGLWRFRRLRAC